MDKTLLRPLFQKRFMELHKPQGFVNGGPAMNFQQIAMGNQSKQNDQGIMNVIREPVSGMDQDVNFQVEEQPRIKSFTDERPKKAVQAKTDAIEQGREKAKQDSLFTDSEKKGIFAAQLAMALSQPGDPFANLAGGLGRGAMSLADLKATEAEFEQKKDKLPETVLRYDSVLGISYDVPKQRVLTEMIDVEGVQQPRFTEKPASASDDKVRMDVVEVKDGAYKIDNILRKNFDQKIHKPYIGTIEVERRMPNGEYVKETITKNEYLDDDARISSEKKFRVTDKVAEGIRQDRLIREERARIDSENEIKKTLNKLRRVSSLGKRGLEYLDAGAAAGTLGNTTQTFAGFAGFLKNLIHRKETSSEPVNAFGKGALDEADYNKVVNLLGKDRTYNPDAEVDGVKIAVLNSKFQKLDSGLQSIIIELAYAKAKSREEGGRFSVSDIQAAMQSIGDSSNPEIMIAKLSESLYNDLNVGLESWNEKKFGALPDEYKSLVDDRDMFLGRTPLGSPQKKKKIDLPAPPLSNEKKKLRNQGRQNFPGGM